LAGMIIMNNILLGLAGFGIIHLFDLVAICRIRYLKPVMWITGIGLLIAAVYGIAATTQHAAVPAWLTGAGYLLTALSLAVLVYALFGNLPFRQTYLEAGIGQNLVTTGLYGLVRHPGIYPYAGLMLSMVLLFPSAEMATAAAIWLGADLGLIWVQDKFIFPRMFAGYRQYQAETPMLIPSGAMLKNYFGKRFARLQYEKNKTYIRSGKMSKNVELFKNGEHQEMWQRCCGFIDLSIEEFMLIQKRLLLEQLELVKKCELGQKILGGAHPETLEEFRNSVPLTTYADYAPHLLKRRMEGLPRKPILWQCTSGKSGESTFRWVPVTARQLDEIEPLIFALIFFSSCQNRGEIKFRERDKVFYGMAPPPYATGTMTRVLPHEIFDFLPPVEMSEQVSFEERTKMGFKMALEDGLDLCFAMSSVAVAIGNRFGGSGSSSTFDRKYLMAHPGMAVRLLRGLIKSKMAGRKMLPRDVWNLKGMITFGLDGAVYREKIKEMWGRYPLDFHGCTEAVVIATQTWDYEGMTFVPNLNFFEFITEQDSIRSSQDPDFVPPTYLLNEIKPGNYELVITSFHGGPFIRYRLGHLVKIHSVRNEKLDIDIPQMSFIGRIDDQIDIAGFTRLSEKVIWQAVEKTGIEYAGWTARKEIEEKPVLNIYLELKGEARISAQQAAMLIHKQLKKLDVPYSELESFTGLNPLTVTLLPRGAFAAYKQYQVAQGADITRLKPPHLNAADEMIEVLMQPAAAPAAAGEAVRV